MARTVLYLILIGKFYLFIMTSGKTRIINLETEPLYTKAGDPLRLVCEQTQGFKTTWFGFVGSNLSTEFPVRSENMYEPIATIEGFNEKVYDKHGKHLNIIEKEIAEVNDTGSYCCNVLSNLDRSYCVDVIIFKIKSRDGMMLKSGERTSIGCEFSSESKISPIISWLKAGRTIIPEAEGAKYSINSTWIDNDFISQLSVLKTFDRDVGTYECHLMLANNATFVQQVQITSAPVVKISERSLNVKEQDTAKVVCQVWGWPAPTVQWFKGLENESIVEISNSPHNNDDTDVDGKKSIRVYASSYLNEESQKKLQLATTSSLSTSSSSPTSPSTTYPDQQNVSTEFPLGSNHLSPPASHDSNLQPMSALLTLVIRDARMSDRSVYVCEASAFINGSKILKSRATIMVRVKGRYACLYPMAGVVLEFLILLIIIIIYERKKRRDADDINNADENNLFQPLVRRTSGSKTRK